MITYIWIKNNQIKRETSNVLTFSPLILSDAARYTCEATVTSASLITSNIVRFNTHDVIIQSEFTISPDGYTIFISTHYYSLLAVPAPIVMLTSSIPNPIPPFGSNITLTCTVDLTSILKIDIPLNVTFKLSRTDPPGPALINTPPSVSGYTHTTTAVIRSFGRSDSGVYTCRANVGPRSPNSFITDSRPASDSEQITTGENV